MFKKLNFLRLESIQNFSFYFIGAAFLKGISFLLIPIYTRVLSPEEFGVLELLNNLCSILILVTSLGAPQILTVEYYSTPSYERIKLANQLTSAYFLVATPFFIFLFLLFGYFDDEIFKTKLDYLLLIMFFLFAYFSFFQNVFFAVLQISKKAKILTITRITMGLFTAGLNLLLVYHYRMSVKGIFIANTTILLALIVYIFLYTGKYRTHKLFKVDKSARRLIITTGFQFVIGGLAYWVMSGIDRWIILFELGKEEVGHYSLAYKFGSITEPLIIAPILSVYAPYIFDRFSKNDYNQHGLKLSVLTILLATVLGFGIKFLASLMVDKRFYQSLYFIPGFVFGFAFYFLAQIFGSIMVYTKKIRALLFNIILSCVVNIILNYYLVKNFKLYGAVAAFLISNFFWFTLSYYQSVRAFKLILKSNSNNG